jgi:hypothetical protein
MARPNAIRDRSPRERRRKRQWLRHRKVPASSRQPKSPIGLERKFSERRRHVSALPSLESGQEHVGSTLDVLMRGSFFPHLIGLPPTSSLPNGSYAPARVSRFLPICSLLPRNRGNNGTASTFRGDVGPTCDAFFPRNPGGRLWFFRQEVLSRCRLRRLAGSGHGTGEYWAAARLIWIG